MKTIGLIGGMSWESSLEYYRLINEKIKLELGGLNSAKSLMYSVNFRQIELLQHQNKWEELALLMIEAARKLEIGGADFIIICTNTMHKLADEIEQNISIPLLHIADATAKEIKEKGLKKIALLGTKFTMEEDFYKQKLHSHGIDVIVPAQKDREIVHKIIYEELCVGKIIQSSKKEYINIIESLTKYGAQGVVLGCTEIPLLVQQNDTKIPLFDTTKIHAYSAVNMALKNQ